MQKEERVKVQARTFEKQQEYIAKTEEFIRKNFYGQKSAQAKDREKKLDRVERIEAPREIVGPPMGFAPATRTGDIVVRTEHLSKAFDRPLFNDLTFDMMRGQRWGILGPNGTGKTTLLRVIVGRLGADGGPRRAGHRREGRLLRSDAARTSPTTRKRSRRSVRRIRNSPSRSVASCWRGSASPARWCFSRSSSLSGGERSRTALAQLSRRKIRTS